MAGGGKALAAVVDGVAAKALAGRSLEQVLRDVAEGTGVKVAAEEVAAVRKARHPGVLPALPARVMNEALKLPPSDLRSIIPRKGDALRQSFEALADRFPAIRQRLQQGETLASAIGTKGAPTIAARTAERGAARAALLGWVDLQSREVRALLDEAVAALPAGLRAKVQPLTQRALTGNLESFAAGLARGLGREEGATFVRAVHERICVAIRDGLVRELEDPALAKQIEQVLAETKKLGPATPAVAPLFRARVRGIVADEEAGAVLERVVRRLEGADRERFLREFLASISETAARPVLQAHFDAEGLRRLASAYGSFRKLYTVRRMRAAMEGLIGWLYEASEFTVRVAREAAESFRVPLAAALEGSGVVVGKAPLMHFDVVAPNLAGKASQATDVLGTVSLAGRNRTVHVLASALEAKGEAGVAEGVSQLKGIPRRYRKGAVVTTEHGTFTMGEDLFLSLEDALAKLEVPPKVRQQIVASTRAKTYETVVVSPLPEAAVRARLGKVAYRAHPVSREQMVKVAESLAPRFSLLPLEAGAKAR